MIPVPKYHPFEGYYPDTEPDGKDDPVENDEDDFEDEFFEGNPEDADAHNCRDYADTYGICQFCGAVVPGTLAYSELYGGE